MVTQQQSGVEVILINFGKSHWVVHIMSRAGQYNGNSCGLIKNIENLGSVVSWLLCSIHYCNYQDILTNNS